MVCLVTKMIVGVYCGKGRRQDFGLWKPQKLCLDSSIHIWADLGFLGLATQHLQVHLPHKSSKKHPLTRQQKQENQQQARKRIPIEHVNRQCKLFRICKDVYPGKHRNYGLHWNLIAALTNLKLACRHFSLATP